MFKVCHFCSPRSQKVEEQFSDLHQAIDHAIQHDGYIEGICGYDGGHQQTAADYISLHKHHLKQEWVVHYALYGDGSFPSDIAQTRLLSLDSAISFKNGMVIALNFAENVNHEIRIVHAETKLEY